MDSRQSEPFIEFTSPFGEGACLKYDPLIISSPDFSRILHHWIHAFPYLELPESLQSAAPERRLSYVAGRYCAGLALKRAGAPILKVGFAMDRSPLWPDGWAGSITHSRDGAVGAVAAPSEHIYGLGIDFEQWIGPAESQEIAAEIATQEEIGRIRSSLGMKSSDALTVAFAAKEAFYKALAPRARRFFGFFDAEIHSVVPASPRPEIKIRLTTDLRDATRIDTERLVPGFVAQGELSVSPDRCKILFIIK